MYIMNYDETRSSAEHAWTFFPVIPSNEALTSIFWTMIFWTHPTNPVWKCPRVISNIFPCPSAPPREKQYGYWYWTCYYTYCNIHDLSEIIWLKKTYRLRQYLQYWVHNSFQLLDCYKSLHQFQYPKTDELDWFWSNAKIHHWL